MSVSVYLSNQLIQVAVGSRGPKASVKQIYVTTAPEGSIINGIIMDADALSEHLKKFWNDNKIPTKDIYLILNSNKIVGKNIGVPNMNRKKTIEFIQREFSDMQRDEEENYLAFIPIGKDKNSKLNYIYSEFAPKDQIREFVTLFNNIGLWLKGIISGEGSIIGYANVKLAKKCKTFILQVINGNLVSNILFADGEFKYYSSIRCFNEPGSEGYYEDLARSVTQLGQFMQVQKITSKVERIFIAGTSRDELRFYSQVIKDHDIEAPCEIVDTGYGNTTGIQYESANALFAISGLYDFGSDSNFLNHFSLKEEKEGKVDAKTKKYILTVVIVLIIMIICFLVSLVLRLTREIKYAAVKAENDLYQTQATFFDMEAMRRDNLAAKFNSINDLVEALDSYPVGSKELLKALEKSASGYAEIEITSFNAEQGKISFTAKSANVNDIYKYIDRLLEEEIFMKVEHTGYTYDASTDMYNIHVDCTLAEAVGR